MVYPWYLRHPYLRLTLGLIHFLLEKFSRLQFIWRSRSCLVGERVGESEGGGRLRRQVESTWDVICDQAGFLSFFFGPSFACSPFSVLPASLGKTINFFLTLPRLPRTTHGQLCASYKKVHGLKKGFLSDKFILRISCPQLVIEWTTEIPIIIDVEFEVTKGKLWISHYFRVKVSWKTVKHNMWTN